MREINYEITKGKWAFDDHGNEYWSEKTQEKTAMLVYSKSMNYSSEVETYFAELEFKEAEKLAAEFNSKRKSEYDARMSVSEVPHGVFLEIVTPYDD